MERLVRELRRGCEALRAWPEDTVHVFHHNDSDGLSSGAILTRALEREGYTVKRICLEKPYPPVLERIYTQAGRILIFADFAGRIAPLLSRLNGGRNLTLILDHHTARPSTDPQVLNLDPDLYGLKGDRDISASTTCYLFARELNPANQDLAGLAALGAVGDRFFVEGRLVNQNREAALEAAAQGMLSILPTPSGEQYALRLGRIEHACDELGAYLDVLGAVGYYQDGPELAVRVCLEGVSPGSDRAVTAFRAHQSQVFEAETARLRSGGLNRSGRVQWFDVGRRFEPMGVKMIGIFCETIKDTDWVDPHKYLAGFQRLAGEIPGFGHVTLNQSKVSMRVSADMEEAIRRGAALGLDVLLPAATERLGGFVDACHSLTAATTVDAGKEAELIAELEKILAGAGPQAGTPLDKRKERSAWEKVRGTGKPF